MKSKTEKGKKAEKTAARFLKKKGLKVLTTNFHARHGEIDIIARENDTLCIIEVRSKGPDSPHQPEIDLGAVKQKRLGLAAKEFLHRYKMENVPVRFDLVVVDESKDEREIRYYPGGILTDPLR